jgi:hypothetical protein
LRPQALFRFLLTGDLLALQSTRLQLRRRGPFRRSRSVH